MDKPGRAKASNHGAPDTEDRRSDSVSPSPGYRPTHDEIQQRAYAIHIKRGGHDGNDLDDWLQAEKELLEGQPKEEAGEEGEN